MGLRVHSPGEIPTGAERADYVYLLDYGWDAVRANLPRMADLAARSDARTKSESSPRMTWMPGRRRITSPGACEGSEGDEKQTDRHAQVH